MSYLEHKYTKLNLKRSHADKIFEYSSSRQKSTHISHFAVHVWCICLCERAREIKKKKKKMNFDSNVQDVLEAISATINHTPKKLRLFFFEETILFVRKK